MKSDSSDFPRETQKSYREILLGEILQGEGELKRSTGGLLLSGFSAGLDIGFSVFLMAVMFTLVQNQLPSAIVEILVANLYAVGFIFVVIGRSELFTEHTTLAVFPVLAKQAKVTALVRLWGLVYFSNLVGATIFALLATLVGLGLEVASPEAYGHLAQRLTNHSGAVLLLGGILAGWLMGLLSWLVKAATETISQIFIVWLVTSAIGLGHLPHCIVGTVEILAGLFAAQGITVGDFGRFLWWTTLGNAVGGVLFVAIIKFSHAVQSAKVAEETEVEETARELGLEKSETGNAHAEKIFSNEHPD
ncbi:formate/nitrite transporter family protein [Nitrosococcus watsonii]|uniref:Formate/nitrite transporter n=1 Tax=Nitrosococcus watsoni (strain C-113) TaxID=105559 RepID=D8KAJ6_NITWC|nr:formate/nitrite transporter family protein [Nitrosococcus watsonii]ADJ29423.1 formate/nitrite transporter [Nitrosococcus watsonii C-113]